MQNPAPEVLVCDTTYVVHRERAVRHPAKYAHWPTETLDRIDQATLAVTPFTHAEIRVGWARLGLGQARLTEAENRLRSFVLIPLDAAVLDEWVTLRLWCLSSGVTLSDNDLWIAATAISQGLPLVTSDKQQSQLAGIDAVYLASAPV